MSDGRRLRVAVPPESEDRDALFARLLPLVTAWCIRLGAGRIDAEAAAQDALVVLLRRVDELHPGAPVEPFAWGVVTRVVRDHRRRAWWRRWLPGVTVEPPARGGPAVDLARKERADGVARVLDQLAEEHREVLVLVDAEERSGREAAEILGLPEGTVRSRLRIAREAFRREMANQGVSLVAGLEGDDD